MMKRLQTLRMSMGVRADSIEWDEEAADEHGGRVAEVIKGGRG